jgi:hypothetical protein
MDPSLYLKNILKSDTASLPFIIDEKYLIEMVYTFS